MNREQQDVAKRAARTAVKRRRACGRCFDPEDVVQDAMVLVLELIRDGIDDPAMLYNQIRARLMNTERTPDAEDLADAPSYDVVDPLSGFDIESVDDRDELEVLIRKAGDVLTLSERKVLRMVYLDQTGLLAASQRVGVSVDTADKYLRNAAAKLGRFRDES